MLAQTVSRSRTVHASQTCLLPPHGDCLQVGYKDFGLLSRFLRAAPLSASLYSECKFHTSSSYRCTGWWHSMRALVTVLPQFNTHVKVGCLELPMDVCCRAHASIQEMPDKNGKSAQDFWLPLRTKRGMNSACSSVPPCLLPRHS